MHTDRIPTFDEWVRYCFTEGYADFFAEDSPLGEERRERFLSIPDPTLAEYMLRLCSSPSFIADAYTNHQIASGISFVFGVASEYPFQWQSNDVSDDQQARIMRSVATMYTDLFDRVCNDHGRDPDANPENGSELDNAVYMLWDMTCGIDAIYFPEHNSHLVEPTFGVLETVLFGCRTSSCKYSALHALGHLVSGHAARATAMIDRFLALPDQPGHLREYAQRARTGMIQ